MSNETPPKRDSLVSNPQVLAAVIGGIVTVVVAIIGILPALVNSTPTPTPQPTIVVVTATSEATSTLVSVSNVEPTTAIIPPLQFAVSSTDGNILLLYDDVSFTLRNQSEQMLSLEGTPLAARPVNGRPVIGGQEYTTSSHPVSACVCEMLPSASVNHLPRAAMKFLACRKSVNQFYSGSTWIALMCCEVVR